MGTNPKDGGHKYPVQAESFISALQKFSCISPRTPFCTFHALLYDFVPKQSEICLIYFHDESPNQEIMEEGTK